MLVVCAECAAFVGCCAGATTMEAADLGDLPADHDGLAAGLMPSGAQVPVQLHPDSHLPMAMAHHLAQEDGDNDEKILSDVRDASVAKSWT